MIGTTHRGEFWNIYVFLVDLLPRIPQGEQLRLRWGVMNVFFMSRTTKERFKYRFKELLPQVLGIYKEAKDSVDVNSEKDFLLLYRAPLPPIDIDV